MRYLFVLTILAWSGVSSQAQSVLGQWKTIDDETGKAKSIVEIYKKNGKVHGRIVKLFRSADEDQDPVCKECKGDKKGQKIIGMTILQNMEKDGSEYDSGTILDPKNGKVYDCKIWLDGNNKLMVRGYVGIFFRTQEWKRVQ